MSFFREFKFILIFAVLLTFCSVMVLRQFRVNQSKHAEMREAFILLYVKGYSPHAQRLYNRLLRDLETCSNRELLEDFQRTLVLVDPTSQQPLNLIWKYHWTVSKEMEKRSENTLIHALKLAEQL